ncbi:hypothetical protein VTP01DRAFT_827 [Rhizomucor pusillus]|uniref:uncharacterized protein n=1 Tax=Rhizomucor pusillus TaxID=4840 RepID=UPI00374281C4
MMTCLLVIRQMVIKLEAILASTPRIWAHEDSPPPYNSASSHAVDETPSAPYLNDIERAKPPTYGSVNQYPNYYLTSQQSAPQNVSGAPFVNPTATNDMHIPNYSSISSPAQQHQVPHRTQEHAASTTWYSLRLQADFLTLLLGLLLSQIIIGATDESLADLVTVPLDIEFSQDLKLAGKIEAIVKTPRKVLDSSSMQVDHGIETHFQYHFVNEHCTMNGWSRLPCVDLDMKISMPFNATSLVLDTTDLPVEIVGRMNIDNVNLKTTNAKIHIQKDWKGKQLTLETTNGKIDAADSSIEALESVTLTTTNGNIAFGRVEAIANGRVHLKTSNGKLQGQTIEAASNVMLESTNGQIDITKVNSLKAALHAKTTNGKITLRDLRAATNILASTTNDAIHLNFISAPSASIKTTNGRIDLDHIQVQEQLNVETSNSQTRATVDSHSSDIHANFRTSNSPISVLMIS